MSPVGYKLGNDIWVRSLINNGCSMLAQVIREIIKNLSWLAGAPDPVNPLGLLNKSLSLSLSHIAKRHGERAWIRIRRR